jgi:hypothetical protein
MLSEGTKLDTGKLRLDLIPPEVIFGLGAILTFGAEKYEPHNWEKGMSWGRVFAASMRHLWAWKGAKEKTSENYLFGSMDPETKLSHLLHALACITFLFVYEERQIGEDDRHA